jgi:hypothetical protein
VTVAVPLAEQLAEARRELALRERVYPKQVQNNAMRQGEADRLIARQKAIITTLEWFQEREHELRAYFALPIEDRAIIHSHGNLVAQLAHEVARKEAIAKAGGPVR